MKRRAFTAVEALLSSVVIAITAGVSVPLIRNYQIRNDLNIATDYMLQALRTAQSNARAGKNTGQWGVHPEDALVFEGEEYAYRVTASDEPYPLPPAVSVSGLSEVTFAPVSGRPQTSGEIILTALNGDQRIITIGDQGTIAATGIDGGALEGGTGEGGQDASAMASSHSTVSGGSAGSSVSGGSAGSTAASSVAGGSAASGGQQGSTGSTGGAGSAGGSVASNASSIAGQPQGSSAQTSAQSSTLAGTACTDRFFVSADGTIQTTGRVSAVVKALGSQITYGSGGPEVNVTAQWSTNGSTWTNLYNGNDIDGNETETISNLVSGSRLSFKAKGVYSSFFNQSFTSIDGTGHVEVLRNGERPPSYPAFNNQQSLTSFLRTVLDANGRIAIGQYDVVLLVELGALNSSSADFQDLVLHVQFTQEAGSCNSSASSAASIGSLGSSRSSVAGGSVASSSSAASVTPRFKVVFQRLVNSGNGNAAKKVFVGSPAQEYAESAWVPLETNGSTVTDSGLVANSAGLSAQRGNGWLKIQSHGSLSNGKEIVDAKIVFEGLAVTGIRNDGAHPTENPFDDVVNDNAGGDEVTISDNAYEVLFQTRVTGDDDAIYIEWKKGAPEAGTGAGGGNDGNKKIMVCHFSSGGEPNTIMISKKAWSAHEKHGDHMGTCESDDDRDSLPNYADLCPDTKPDQVKKGLLFFRQALTEADSDIFREGPLKKIGEFDLTDTMGCSCEQLLDVAEGKPGYYFTNLPKLYLQLRSLLDFYVSTARKFGCSRDLLRLIEKNG